MSLAHCQQIDQGLGVFVNAGRLPAKTNWQGSLINDWYNVYDWWHSLWGRKWRPSPLRQQLSHLSLFSSVPGWWHQCLVLWMKWKMKILCTVQHTEDSNLHLSLHRKGHWGTTDGFTTSFLHFSLFSTALWHLAHSRPVHSLTLSSHLFFSLFCHLPAFTVPCEIVRARPDEWETCQYYFSLHLFMMVRRSSCDPIACWILAWTS